MKPADMINRAKVLHSRYEKWRERLAQFPLWERILFFWKFSSIRNKMQELSMERAAMTAMAVGATRLERRYNASRRRNA